MAQRERAYSTVYRP